MVFKTYEVKIKNGIVRGIVEYDKAVIFVDFTDVIKLKDIKGNEIITAGVVPEVYFSE